MLEWLVSYLLWISLVLLLASALTRKQPYRCSRMGPLCILLARPDRALSGHRGLLQCGSLFGGRSLELLHGLDCDEKGLFIKGHAIGRAMRLQPVELSIFLLPKYSLFRSALIGFTTLVTAKTLQLLSVPVIMESWNIMSLNGRSVEIILACTAIESIALFAGVILSVQAPPGRKLAALAASTILHLSLEHREKWICAHGLRLELVWGRQL